MHTRHSDVRWFSINKQINLDDSPYTCGAGFKSSVSLTIIHLEYTRHFSGGVTFITSALHMAEQKPWLVPSV